MRNIENTNERVPNPSPGRRGTRRVAVAAAASLAGLLLMVGCDGMVEEGESVDAESSALRNTGGRTPDQQKCDQKLQSCYINCSVQYPESGGGLNDELREGCFDSCDAAHRLCLPARANIGVGASTVNGVLQAAGTVDTSATASPSTAPAARAAVKSCTPTTDGGLWCCVPISTPPFLKCTYTPPPDTIWTFTQTATRAP